MHVAILGAGIAGLSAATFLRRHPQIKVSVIEASPQVGGLARSLQWQGFHCDLAPHRLYADRRDDVRELLDRVPMHQLRRRSRIHIRGKWIQDPVNLVLGVISRVAAQINVFSVGFPVTLGVGLLGLLLTLPALQQPFNVALERMLGFFR